MYKKGSIHVGFYFLLWWLHHMPIHTLWWWYRISIRTSENPAWTLWTSGLSSSWRWIWNCCSFFSPSSKNQPLGKCITFTSEAPSHVWESYLCFTPSPSTRALCFLPSSHENFWYNISKTESQDALSTVSQLALVSSDRIKEDRKFQVYHMSEFCFSFIMCVNSVTLWNVFLIVVQGFF